VNKKRVHRRILAHPEVDEIRCEFRERGLVCPKLATVFLYGEEISGYFCEWHAQIMEERYD